MFYISRLIYKKIDKCTILSISTGILWKHIRGPLTMLWISKILPIASEPSFSTITKKEILLTCAFETGVWKLVTSERQELLLRMMLATTPDMPLSLRSGRDEQGCLGARDMLGCASQLPACHVFTTRDFQRLSAVYLSKISQLPVCHLLLSNFRNMTSFYRHYITHNCP